MREQTYKGKAPHVKVVAKERRTYKDVVYHSLTEARHAQSLDLRVKAGELMCWLRQVPFQLGPDKIWRVDFVCFNIVFGPLGVPRLDMWAEELKGVNTKDVAEIRRLWIKYAPCRLIMRFVNWGKYVRDEIIEGAPHA